MREHKNQINREYYYRLRKDPIKAEKLKTQNREAQRKWRNANKLKVLENKLKPYGLTVEQYENMLSSQKGQCKLCKSTHRLNIDHCHKTGRVRGILCNKCNRGIGLLQDSQEILSAAIEYLKE